MSKIICWHYFDKQRLDFIFEVLYQENFSFAAKRAIFEAILKKKGIKEKKFPFQELHKLSKIRNYMAHIWTMHLAKNDKIEFIMLGKRDSEKTLQQLKDEFNSAYNRLGKALIDLMSKWKIPMN